MTFRIEEKLHIVRENLFEFKNFLIKKTPKKPFNSRKIKSLYFDNKNFDMYNDSIEGLVPRKKIRVRHYPDSNDPNYYLEVKNSSVEGRFKRRKVISKQTFDEIKKIGILDSQYGNCFPKIYVEYSREYLLIDDVRISIDDNIKYSNFVSNFTSFDQKIIVELNS